MQMKTTDLTQSANDRARGILSLKYVGANDRARGNLSLKYVSANDRARGISAVTNHHTGTRPNKITCENTEKTIDLGKFECGNTAENIYSTRCTVHAVK